MLLKQVYAERSWSLAHGKFQRGIDDTGLILKFWDKSSYLKWELFQQYFCLYLSTVNTGSVYTGMNSILRREYKYCILAYINSLGANMCGKEKSNIEILTVWTLIIFKGKSQFIGPLFDEKTTKML